MNKVNIHVYLERQELNTPTIWLLFNTTDKTGHTAKVKKREHINITPECVIILFGERGPLSPHGSGRIKKTVRASEGFFSTTIYGH